MLNQAAVEALYSAAYLDDYVDCMEFLPNELQRSITQMRELDLKYQTLLREMEQHLQVFRAETDNVARKRSLIHIQRALIKTQELGDDKLQLMSQVIDVIENRARQLDTDYHSLEMGKPEEKSDVARQQPEERGATYVVPISRDKASLKRSRRAKPDTAAILRDVVVPLEVVAAPVVVEEKLRPKKKKRKTKVEKERTPDSPVAEAIDPNEPVYCLCQQVSFGEMVGCDYEHCPIEWFHFSCVKLVSKPKGRWYCPRCRGDNSKTCRYK
ncbi:PREDICTED: inhibitor of growth protein 2-like [Priapulus caudatus]|uniref:Inhibitor of growth protein n=1 Tax=Priapulus caudatus TaxID=37621 RepID=A0ABM1EJQ8_PRICU|nr:PREDICTED: inhibitor of growth protein 2-like [Priapulus caudatus]